MLDISCANAAAYIDAYEKKLFGFEMFCSLLSSVLCYDIVRFVFGHAWFQRLHLLYD